MAPLRRGLVELRLPHHRVALARDALHPRAIEDVYQFSAACLQLDIDFGASPNLFRDVSGRLVVGAMQKSGVYHAVYGDSMERAWRATLSPPSPAGNAASTAFDGRTIFVPANAGATFALAKDSGVPRWTSAIADSLRYMPVSIANGVLYALDASGNLNGLDTATGLSVLQRSISADTGETISAGGLTSVGLSIARNTVFVAANASSGHWIVAYRLP